MIITLYKQNLHEFYLNFKCKLHFYPTWTGLIKASTKLAHILNNAIFFALLEEKSAKN